MLRRKTPSEWYRNLYIVPILISLVGLYFIFEGSSIRALTTYDDSLFFIKRQAIWFICGVISMFILSRFDYRRLYIFAIPSMIFTFITLIAVLIPGIGSRINGARRWIDLGPFGFQPAEFAKLSIVLYLSAWFRHREKQRIIAFILLLLALAVLIMAQPDMGTAIITIGLALGIYFIAGIDMRQLLWVIPIFIGGALITAQSATYRLHRLRVLLDSDLDPLGIGYQVRQIMIAIQNGGLLGLGFGGSKQKYLFLPEAHTDSIFAIFVEEMGFVGAVGLISLYALLLYYLYRVTMQTRDRFGFMLSSSILIFFGLQSFLNLAAMTRLAPLTGVPLPFMSNGGTNMLISYILIGISISIARFSRQITPKT